MRRSWGLQTAALLAHSSVSVPLLKLGKWSAQWLHIHMRHTRTWRPSQPRHAWHSACFHSRAGLAPSSPCSLAPSWPHHHQGPALIHQGSGQGQQQPGQTLSVLFSTFPAFAHHWPHHQGPALISPGQWARANNVEAAAWPNIASPGHCRACAPLQEPSAHRTSSGEAEQLSFREGHVPAPDQAGALKLQPRLPVPHLHAQVPAHLRPHFQDVAKPLQQTPYYCTVCFSASSFMSRNVWGSG